MPSGPHVTRRLRRLLLLVAVLAAGVGTVLLWPAPTPDTADDIPAEAHERDPDLGDGHASGQEMTTMIEKWPTSRVDKIEAAV